MTPTKALSILVICTSVLAFGQQPVTVDWTTRSLGQHPGSVERDTDITVRVEHVNDVMFNYSINLSGTPREHFDFSEISKAFQLAGKGAAEGVGCDEDLVKGLNDSAKTMTDATTSFLKLPETIASGCSLASPCNVTLEQGRTHWGSDVAPKLASTKKALSDFTVLCRQQQYEAVVKSVQDALDKSDRLASSVQNDNHVVTKNDVLKPDYDYVLTISQLYQGVVTKDGTATLELKPSNNRLNLSAGVLFSEVQNRSYSSVSAPDPSGTGTQNVLVVSGKSQFSPSAIALLNYQLPKLDKDTFGLAFSSGPVFRLGSKSDTSSFGFFAGVGIHLFHRVFITPGAHLGEFADFPAGFTHDRQVVPAGLSSPTAVKRWTWRFALALSYKAKDFSSFGLSGTVTQPSGSTKAGSTTGAQSPDAQGAGQNNSKQPQKPKGQ